MRSALVHLAWVQRGRHGERSGTSSGLLLLWNGIVVEINPAVVCCLVLKQVSVWFHGFLGLSGVAFLLD